MIEQKCETCAFFVSAKDNKGFCHRLPPTSYPMMNQPSRVIGMPNVPNIGQISMFPIIGEDDFCGEWQNDGE